MARKWDGQGTGVPFRKGAVEGIGLNEKMCGDLKMNCHAERSEAPMQLHGGRQTAQVLRFAQDDKSEAMPRTQAPLRIEAD